MQKTLVKFEHHKIVFVKLSRVSLEISETFIDPDGISLISVWKKFYWDPKEQSTRQHKLSTKLVQHTGEVSGVRIEIKHLVHS